MIQRIQSVFLLAAIAVGVALFAVPLYSWTDPQGKVISETMLARTAFLALSLLIMLLGLAALFMYNRRPLQWKIALGAAALSVVTFILVFLFTKEVAGMPEATVVRTEAGTWAYLVMDFLFVMSFVFIRKDENLVRSADRIR